MQQQGEACSVNKTAGNKYLLALVGQADKYTFLISTNNSIDRRRS